MSGCISKYIPCLGTLRHFAGAAAAAAMLAGPAAAAVTFTFEDGINGANGKYNQNAGNMYSATVDGITVEVFAGIYRTDDTGAVTETDINCGDGSCGIEWRVLRKAHNGLGIKGWIDGIHDVDGHFGNDLLTFVFDVPVVLKNVVFRKIDDDDRVDVIVDGALEQDEVDIFGHNPFSFGEIHGISFGFGADDDVDNFRIAQLTVETVLAPVPLPAAGLLMLGALGGLGFAARRTRKS